MQSDTAILRRFNRMYTRFIGTLDEHLLDSGYGLSQARVLYELANREAPRAGEIAADLGMDTGYLSRILKEFEQGGLLRKKAAKEDGRFSELALTRRGRSEFQELNRRSEAQAQSVLDGLAPEARLELIRSMRSIEKILSPAKPSACVLRPPRGNDLQWVVYREGVGYAEQYGWDGSFEALVARIVQDFIHDFDERRERCWIAELDGENVGHIFLVKHPNEPGTAKLRLLFVEPSARGKGVGQALVDECLRFARAAGYRKVVLWTQSILEPAIRIYQLAGFRLVREEPHHSFGHDLIGQEWELELGG